MLNCIGRRTRLSNALIPYYRQLKKKEFLVETPNGLEEIREHTLAKQRDRQPTLTGTKFLFPAGKLDKCLNLNFPHKA